MHRLKRDHVAGALVILVGVAAILAARSYDVGTIERMGPGYFPMALGILLLAVGAGIGLTASNGSADADQDAGHPADIRGWLCILLGVGAFIVFAWAGGLGPAAFACVFVSAWGDRTATLKGALMLALCISVFAVVVFAYLLGLPLPAFRWGPT
jgi:putative Ca2+/H+ antiporter (TMEM165/GDT1 family)